ncbi:translational GTPase TypA [Acinetobacter baumannii]|uniref:translational GTPase TypA n=1 Tax=Acinetobacter baumannii TaxID=470 RepID=UPI0012DCF0DF|nr:translational GTPase TypA [Acinetobacter baumannii]MBF1845644.1 translational GTPase TypA [Acinetobacter baumannii]MBS4732124.1 translational GTPase TypA [Acinetobacter baumannii]MCH1875760.1 translational GTPase TypA [Acinetobacter baumannii]MCQ4669201.1 translational GTPase TypA [Acinetobacter baumannii]MCQ4715242.1 translational GTPase TypA [Acinetobacter baumannii]
MSDIKNLRNIAIIAHVDHGKTTLVDKLLQQSGALGDRAGEIERVMDSNALESERGITILAKNTAITWLDKRTDTTYRINIVDTPGHADFGGEVERVMSMVDCVLLLVDSQEGPMPQTRFVTQKAFARGLKPIVIINKVDKPSARPDWVIDQVFDLFDNLGATDEQLDFPIVYASGLRGVAGPAPEELAEDMTPLFETIVDIVEPPAVDVDGPFQMQISSLDYNSFVGVIGVGRIQRGSVKLNTPVTVIDKEGNTRNGRILKIMGYHGLERIDVDSASAGDIVCITGIDALNISDTICDPKNVEALPPLSVDEPTVSMTFQVNNSPFAGKEGKFVTSRNIRERLDRELIHNVALRVEDTDSPDRFKVSGRGELHLSVLIENMRREGFELGVSRPQVIIKEIDGGKQEPYENVTFDVEEQHQGAVMEQMGHRKGEMTNMEVDGKGRIRIEATVPSRGLIGFRSEFLTMTSGTGIMTSSFSHYGPLKQGTVAKRQNGVLISMVQGTCLGYALFSLQDRGRLFAKPQLEVYEGMIVGINSRSDDMVVNPTKAKQLTNVRASGTDDALTLTPAIEFTLEQALEFIEDDELVEVTPKSIRIRKRYLTENERKRNRDK